MEDTLGRASPEIRSFREKIQGHLVRGWLLEKPSRYSTQLCNQEGLDNSSYPGPEKDQLYPAEYRHKHGQKHRQQSPTKNHCICDDCKNQDDDVCTAALKISCKDLGCDDMPSSFNQSCQTGEFEIGPILGGAAS